MSIPCPRPPTVALNSFPSSMWGALDSKTPRKAVGIVLSVLLDAVRNIQEGDRGKEGKRTSVIDVSYKASFLHRIYILSFVPIDQSDVIAAERLYQMGSTLPQARMGHCRKNEFRILQNRETQCHNWIPGPGNFYPNLVQDKPSDHHQGFLPLLLEALLFESPTMSLEDLTQFVAPQQHKINELVNQPDYFSDSGRNLPLWAAFRDSLWGRGLEFLRDPLSDATRNVAKIPGEVPRVMGFSGDRILIRSDYEETEQAVLSVNAQGLDALIINGQSGIGSSPLVPSSAERNHSIREIHLFDLAPHAAPHSRTSHGITGSGELRPPLP
jgi:hypothetical protein